MGLPNISKMWQRYGNVIKEDFMPYCSNCRNQLPDGATVCNYCGTVYQKKIVSNNTYTASSRKRIGKQINWKNMFSFKNRSYEFYNYDTMDNRILACLSYIGLLSIIPLVFKRKSPYVVFHINQGIINFVLTILILLFFSIIDSLIFQNKMPFDYATVFGYIYLTVAVFGIVQCIMGKAIELPIFGKIKIFKTK